MSELFAAFRQHLVWSLMLWVVIFTAFTAVFANGRLLAFAGGLVRVLGSIIVTPFLFIKRAVIAVLGHDHEAESRFRASDQYLLNKGMLVLQAIVIVAAVGVLSAAVVMTWNTLVPPSEVRRAARDYARDVEKQRENSIQSAAVVTRLDEVWAQKEQAAVAAYRQERQARIASDTKEMTGIEASVQSYAGPNGINILQEVKRTISSRSNDSYDSIERTKSRIDSIVYNNWYWLGDWRGSLERWNQLWQTRTIAEFQMKTLSVEELRSAEQPSYAEAKSKRDQDAATLTQMEQVLAEQREAASLKWKAAFLRALASFITFLAFVWVVGALIEGVWMAIHVADDVRRIRQTPSVVSAVVGGASESDARIPIRESIPAHAVTKSSPAEM